MSMMREWFQADYKIGYAEASDPHCRGCGKQARVGEQVITGRYRIRPEDMDPYRRRFPHLFEKSDFPELYGGVIELWHLFCAEKVSYKDLGIVVGPGGGPMVRDDRRNGHAMLPGGGAGRTPPPKRSR